MGRPDREPTRMRVPRFHVVEAAPGACLDLPEHSAHHAREVLRLRSGSAIRVFDGRGNEYDGVPVCVGSVKLSMFKPPHD